MTSPHDPSHDHDDALHRAWRASSRESPPAELDDAILAAAHRAVGAKPRRAGAEALRPPKWWLPFAAAAVIGVVAVGVVQLAPHDATIDVTSGEARAPSVTQVAKAKEEAGTSVQEAEVAAPTTPPATPTPPAASPPAVAPSPAPARAPAPAPAGAPAPSTAPAPPVAPAPSPPPPSPPPAPAAPKSMPAPPAEPMPFPAAPPPLAKLEAAREARKDILVRDTIAPPAQASAESAGRVAMAPPPPMPAAPAAKEDAAQAPASALAGTGGSADAQRAQAQRPQAPRAEAAARTLDAPSAAFTERARSSATTGNLAQVTKPAPAARAEALERAKDPDAWIERIRKLRDGGREDQAIAELREYDALVPDAKQRMPSELRRLMEAEGRK